jgi:hypothetical protein
LGEAANGYVHVISIHKNCLISNVFGHPVEEWRKEDRKGARFREESGSSGNQIGDVPQTHAVRKATEECHQRSVGGILVRGMSRAVVAPMSGVNFDSVSICSS